MCENSEEVLQNLQAHFRSDVLKDVLRLNFSNTKTKISEDGVTMINEVLKAMLVETIQQVAKPKNSQANKILTLNQFEKVLPQIVFDFL